MAEQRVVQETRRHAQKAGQRSKVCGTWRPGAAAAALYKGDAAQRASAESEGPRLEEGGWPKATQRVGTFCRRHEHPLSKMLCHGNVYSISTH